MKLLICGGREFNDMDKLHAAIMKLPLPLTMIIEGGAPGADRLAKQWAIKHGIHYAEVPALWEVFGKSTAGPLRNKAMLILKPDYCLAMPGNRGTADMVSKCNQLCIPVWEPYK